jgi:ribose 5-phosphate isomerase B
VDLVNERSKLAIASDHGGFQLKEEIKTYLTELGIEYKDLGVNELVSVDYPDVAWDVAKRVAQGEFQRAILICGTGIGMCIVANKVKGIRAALCHDVFSAKMAREHNDANVLALGGRVIGSELAKVIVETWLTGEFTGGRHQRRVERISQLEGE